MVKHARIGAVVAGLFSLASSLVMRASPVPPDDPVASLAVRLEQGHARLDARTDGLGYLPALMTALGVPVDSQMLVFAKNSFQSNLISPRTPRAIYFSDRVYVGFIPRSEVVELIAVDPAKGLQFYTFRNAPSSTGPRLDRQTAACQGCHGRGTNAALTVSSVVPDKDGRPFLAIKDTGPVSTDHRTPLERRWGGWYVTGTHGDQRHMGNAVARLPYYPFALEQENTQNRTTLAGKVDTSPYVTASSDIVALMTFEHQVYTTNLLLELARRARAATGAPSGELDGRAVDAGIDELVESMLLVEEAPLRGPVAGTSTFTATFPRRGPHDRRGRSLKDFDLQSRLFKYPLSYTIYSAEFDALPSAVRTRVYRRLYDALSGDGGNGALSRFSMRERRTALEIVRETKRDVPAFWRVSAGGD